MSNGIWRWSIALAAFGFAFALGLRTATERENTRLLLEVRDRLGTQLNRISELMEIDMSGEPPLEDRWTAALGEGTRTVIVRTYREEGESDEDFSARHEALVQARAATAPPVN